jgi:hypothetical protein
MKAISNATRHLLKAHGKVPPADESLDVEPSEYLPDVLELQRNGAKRSKVSLVASFADRFRDYLLRWIVIMNVAFTAVESPLFRDLLSLGFKTINYIFPKTADTIRNWTIKEFRARKNEIRRQLREDSRSLIHLSFDLWTSPNSLAMVGVVAHIWISPMQFRQD